MNAAPNIIVCLVDQLRAFEVGCYGNPVIRTPNVDRLAADGVRFETAVTNYPVCMAARSVLLSGQYNRWCTGGVGNVSYPSKPGDHNMPEYPEYGRPHLKDPTLPEVLKGLGYHTSVIGKWHIHSWPHEVGFDEYTIPRVHHCHSGQSFTHNGAPEFVPPGYSVDFEAQQVESFLNARRGQNDPFFLYYNISIPHCPVADAPDRFTKLYRPDEIPLRPNVDLSQPLKDQDHWFKVYRYDFRYYNLGLPYANQLPPGYSLPHLIAEYYGLTTWMDATVARMLAALKASGLEENTIVVFAADHGDNLGSHGLVQKGGPTEESIRIPLLVCWPGTLPAGKVISDQVTSLVDLAPTLISMAGGPVQAHMHGRDLSAALLGEEGGTTPRHAFVETSSGVGIRTPDHLYYLPWQSPSRQLDARPSHYYDLRSDPYQMQNLADQPDPPAAELDKMLRAWHAGLPFREM